MIRCDNCGKIFEEPKIVQESRGEYFGRPAYEDWAVCPFCGDDDLEYDYEMEEDDEESELEEPDYDEEYEYYKNLGVFEEALHDMR